MALTALSASCPIVAHLLKRREKLLLPRPS